MTFRPWDDIYSTGFHRLSLIHAPVAFAGAYQCVAMEGVPFGFLAIASQGVCRSSIAIKGGLFFHCVPRESLRFQGVCCDERGSLRL